MVARPGQPEDRQTPDETRADGGSATTQAVDIDPSERRWHARPAVGTAIRLATFLLPVVVSIAAVRVYVVYVPRPDALVPTIGYWAIALGVSVGVMVATERVMRRFTPLATLFTLSLVFPDAAPSRFSTALRSGSLRKFEERLAAGEPVAPQEAATALLGLVAQVGKHDRLTRGHSERVRAFTDMLAEELDLPQDDRDKLRWAALIHDVGKLTVPAEILQKAGRPTLAEWEVLRGHPAAAAALVEPLRPWLGDWVLAATEHHERWDGGGYPRGLKGEEISPAGRIVAVADAYDVMTAARSYKQPLSPTVARQELTRNAGSQFDPTVVRAMLNVSMGRLRFVVGPLGWLNEIAWIARVPQAATTAAATASSAVAALAVAATAPLVDAPPVEEVAPPAERIVVVEPEPDEAVAEPAPTPTEPVPTTTAAPTTTTTMPEDEPEPEPADAAAAPTSTSTSTTSTAVPTTTAPATTTTPPPATTTTTTPKVTTTTTTTPKVTTTTTTTPKVTTTTTTTVKVTTTTTPPAPPVANADSSTFTWLGGDSWVLANDVAGSSPIDPATLEIVTAPPDGMAWVTPHDSIWFAPWGFEGTTQLTYEICDEDRRCDTAVLTVTVTVE